MLIAMPTEDKITEIFVMANETSRKLWRAMAFIIAGGNLRRII